MAGADYETIIHLKLYKYDELECEYVEDSTKLPLSGHELMLCPTIVWASDREASIR